MESILDKAQKEYADHIETERTSVRAQVYDDLGVTPWKVEPVYGSGDPAKPDYWTVWVQENEKDLRLQVSQMQGYREHSRSSLRRWSIIAEFRCPRCQEWSSEPLCTDITSLAVLGAAHFRWKAFHGDECKPVSEVAKEGDGWTPGV